MILAVDKMFDGCIMNPEPPDSRRSDNAIVVIDAPGAGTKNQTNVDPDAPGFLQYWEKFKRTYYKALDNKDAATVCIDGDSDTWELQRLAAFGKLTQIPSILYTDVNAARRALVSRGWQSGKNVIATNKVKQRWVDKLDSSGNVVMANDGKTPVRIKSDIYDREGFDYHEFCWHVELAHLYKPASMPDLSGLNPIELLKAKAKIKREGLESAPNWGIRLLKCKPKKSLEGAELWGDQCNFAGLVQFIFPNVPLSDWGF